jgi:predicted nucleotide-binding protein
MYSVLVTGFAQDATLNDFAIPQSRFLEHTDNSIAVQLSTLSNEAVECIKSWPFLLMQEGRGREVAAIAKVVGVQSTGAEIRISLQRLANAPEIVNDTLWKLRNALDLEQFEFNRNHWAFKDRDLFDALASGGLAVDAAIRSKFANNPLPAPTRAALVAARTVISEWSHTDMDDLILEAGVENLVADRGVSRRDRAIAIIKFAIENPSAVTAENSLFSVFLIKRANIKSAETEGPSSPIAPKPAPEAAPRHGIGKSPTQAPNRVFVVHGRDETIRLGVVNFLKSVGLSPVILHEQPNMGRHLLTKFVGEAELVTFAVVLMTADDVGGQEPGALRPRARQNVILELGYFLAYLGQAKVCALITPGLETPSDFDGIVYVKMEADAHWQTELLRELRAAEMPVTKAEIAH